MEEERKAIVREMIQRQTIAPVLRDHGIEEDEFIRWLEEGEVAAYLYRMAKTKAMAKTPEMWFRLERLAEEGDLKAIRLYYDLCEKMQGEEAAGSLYTNPEVEAARKEIFGDE